MTRGLDRAQIGVTEQMVDAYGETIWRLSHNVQIRRGDPVRELDWDAIEANRDGTGLSDGEIAERIGLTREQVLFIRVLLERRKFQRHHYYRLYELGGGRRFRKERFVPHEDRFTFADSAMRIRETLTFDPERAAHHLRTGEWSADTVPAWLAERARTSPDRIAIKSPAGETTYAEAYDSARRLAGTFVDLGLKRGDVVAVQLPNVTEFLLVYFAVTMFGGILSTLHMPYREAEMRPLVDHSGARAVVCGAATEAYDAPREMLGLASRCGSLEHVVVAGGEAPNGARSLADMIAEGDPDRVGDGPVASDPAILCFTSGTSSAPKAVVHNYHTMLSNNRLCEPLYGLKPDDIFLSGAPFTHAFGICIINFALLAGGTQLLMPLFTPDALARTIESERPSQLFVAPAHVAACLQSGAFDGRDLSSVRAATISGSACPRDLAAALDARLDGIVGQMWGMTECFMGLVTPFDGTAEIRHATLGPTQAVEMRLVAESGEPAAIGEDGEIQIRGASVVPGYFGNEDATRQAFSDGGWFRTGDLAAADAEGHVRITGRVKDVINRGGIKINPTDVEALVDGHPSVAQSAIVPMPDPVLGEKACMFVTLVEGAALTLDDVLRYLEEHDVAKFKWPERLEIVDAMPMTPTRKIIKSELARRLAGTAG
jgi:cyclohexanecarboxylate-CoA ligase/acyl-CoA synthetase